MTPDTSCFYKQLHRHEPSEGLIGDCWRTCIANLLGLKPQAVPHFVQDNFGDGTDAAASYKATRDWLAARNLSLLSIALYTDEPQTFDFGLSPYIMGGRSGRSDISHVVLGHGNFQILHDPSNSPESFSAFECDATLRPYYWCHFLIPINLAGFLKIPFPEPAESAIVIPSANDSPGS